MRVTTRHRPPDPAGFLVAARQVLVVLAAQPGFRSGEVGRSPDDPAQFLLTTGWDNVGSMRRGMGAFDAKVALAPVMVSAADEVSVFEVLIEVRGGRLIEADSARANDQAPAGDRLGATPSWSGDHD